MLPNVEFASAYVYFLASKAKSISKPFKLAIHMLCKPSPSSTCDAMECPLLSKILNLELTF